MSHLETQGENPEGVDANMVDHNVEVSDSEVVVMGTGAGLQFAMGGLTRVQEQVCQCE